MVRNMHMGHWCGYVGAPEGHPEYGKNDTDFDVHGGITYSGHCQGHICHTHEEAANEPVWWLGFDCGHGHDLQPGGIAVMQEVLGRRSVAFDGVYRDMEYVKGQCRSLAAQLKERQDVANSQNETPA